MRGGTHIYNQRDIILVDFPFTDFSKRKVRPALILSKNSYINREKDVLCCALTSKEKDKEEAVKVTDSHTQGEYQGVSWVLADKIMCFAKTEIHKTIGILNIQKSKEIVEKSKATIEIED